MKTVFFDLDGVLADFVRGLLALHRADLTYSSVRWGVEEQLGYGDRLAEFWGMLGFDFWSNLPVYEDGAEVLRLVSAEVGADRIGFLTSPCDTDGCLDGKRAWVAKHFPDYKRRLFLGSAKHLFAGPGKLLIDDHDANVDAFKAAGGLTVQPPRPWNRWRADVCAAGRFDPAKVTAEVLGCV